MILVADLLTEKYAPKSVDEMLGNDENRESVKRWILNWISGQKRRPLLVYGPPGVGKTSIAYALMRQYDLEIIEMSSNELRNKKRVERVISASATTGTLSGKTRLILIDDVDIFIGRKDTGGLPTIVRILKEANCPIILTATDVWDKKLAPLRTACEKMEMKKVSRGAIKKLLAKVSKQENMDIPEEIIESMAENSVGDVRSSLVDLQKLAPSMRDRKKDIFNRVRTIFKATTYREAREALAGDLDYDLLKLWIDENIPNEYEDIGDVARAYYWLSRADLFEGRIRKNIWILFKYSLDLMTAGVALSKEQKYRKFTKYSFPKYLKEMSISVQRRAMLKSIGLKVGPIVHTNYKDASAYYVILSKLSPEVLEDFYKLNEDEIKFIKLLAK